MANNRTLNDPLVANGNLNSGSVSKRNSMDDAWDDWDNTPVSSSPSSPSLVAHGSSSASSSDGSPLSAKDSSSPGGH